MGVVFVPYIPQQTNDYCREYICTQINNITQSCSCKPIEYPKMTSEGILISMIIAIFIFLLVFIIVYYLTKGD